MAYSSSASERLAAVRAAIDKCLNAQAYGAGSRRTQYAELAQLRQIERELMQEVAMESAGGMQAQVGVRVPAS